MNWETALNTNLALGGNIAYHPMATVFFESDGSYTVYTPAGGDEKGLNKEEVEAKLASIGANDENWSDE